MVTICSVVCSGS